MAYDVSVVSSGRGFRAASLAMSLAWAAAASGRRTLAVLWTDGACELTLDPGGDPVPGGGPAHGSEIIAAELPTVPFRGFDLLHLADERVDASLLHGLRERLARDYDTVVHVPAIYPSLAASCEASLAIARQSNRLVIVTDQHFPNVVRATHLAKGLAAGTGSVLAVDPYNPGLEPSLDEIAPFFNGMPIVLFPAGTGAVRQTYADGLLAVERTESASHIAGIRELLSVLDAGQGPSC